MQQTVVAGSLRGAMAAPGQIQAAEQPKQPVVAFGPELPEIGSWQWIGADLAEELAGPFATVTFAETIPRCDVVVVVKYHAAEIIPQVPADIPVIYCPVDCYGSAAEIDRDWQLLRRCARIVVHAEPLRKYFQSYAPVEFLDHHVKFAAPLRDRYQTDGPILWTGLRTNLPPVVEWVNSHGLPEELVVLTNLREGEAANAGDFGFRNERRVRIELWTAERQRELTALARGAIDVKGSGFRQRHKPPAKAVDFLASAVPVAVNADGSTARYLRRLGFDPVSPEETDRWLSEAYWEETRRFGGALRELLSRQRVAGRFAEILQGVLSQCEARR